MTSPAPTWIEFCPTNRCNGQCSFCYARGHRSSDHDMTDDTALAAFTYWRTNMAERGNRPVHICWLGGGEPTLRWEWLLKQVEVARAVFAPRRVTFGYPTNGGWMPEGWIERWKAVGGSMRWSCEWHPDTPTLRGFRREQMLANARLIAAAGWRQVRSTIVPEFVPHMRQALDVFSELGYDNFCLHPAHEQAGRDPAGWMPAVLDELDRQTRMMTDWYIDQTRAGRKIHLWHIARGLHCGLKGLTKRPGQRANCDPTHKRAVEFDGRFIPCHRWCGLAHEHDLGDVWSGFRDPGLRAKMLNRCQDTECIAYPGCAEGCPHPNHLMTGDYATPHAIYCRYFVHAVHEARRAWEVLMAEGCPTYLNQFAAKFPPSRMRWPLKTSRAMLDAIERRAAQGRAGRTCGAGTCQQEPASHACQRCRDYAPLPIPTSQDSIIVSGSLLMPNLWAEAQYEPTQLAI